MQTIFADANSGYERARYVICGVPFDGTSCFRKGSKRAPGAMREVSYNFETYSRLFDIDLGDVSIHDAGDLDVTGNIDTILEGISSFSDKVFKDGKIPVMLGGEHSLSLPFIQSCKKNYPGLGVVVLDAHLDLREEYEGERNSHACISRRILEEVPERYVSLGIRSGTQEEYRYVHRNNVKVFSADDVFNTGIEQIVQEIRSYMHGPLYVSIDVDAVDPAFAPAVGTPEPYGLTPRDVRSVIACLAPDIVGIDVVEIAPAYDSGGTAILGAKLVRDFIAASAKASL